MSVSIFLGSALQLPHAWEHFRAEKLDRVQGLLAADRAEAQVENPGAELVFDPLDLRQDPVGPASEQLALLDPLIERPHPEAGLLGLGVAAVIAGFRHRRV